MMIPLELISIFCTYFFFEAGLNKIKGFQKTVDGFQKKIPAFTKSIPYFCEIIIVSVIILEIAGPLLIVYSSLTKKKQKIAKLSCVSLVIFTILATLLYHPTDFSSNMSVMGGLLLLNQKFN